MLIVYHPVSFTFALLPSCRNLWQLSFKSVPTRKPLFLETNKLILIKLVVHTRDKSKKLSIKKM